MKKRSKSVALGTLIAAAIGYITGLLTAPKSGKETRKDVQKAALKAKADTEAKLKEIHSELSDLIDSAKGRTQKLQASAKKELNDAVEQAQAAKTKARGLLSALHEGDSVDHDLQKAVKEANAAADHLKKFIHKHDEKESAKK